jgi:hypothetical protein
MMLVPAPEFLPNLFMAIVSTCITTAHPKSFIGCALNSFQALGAKLTSHLESPAIGSLSDPEVSLWATHLRCHLA